MTGHQWLEVLIGVAIALVLTWLLLTALLSSDAPGARSFSWQQRTVGFRRVVPCATAGCG